MLQATNPILCWGLKSEGRAHLKLLQIPLNLFNACRIVEISGQCFSVAFILYGSDNLCYFNCLKFISIIFWLLSQNTSSQLSRKQQLFIKTAWKILIALLDKQNFGSVYSLVHTSKAPNKRVMHWLLNHIRNAHGDWEFSGLIARVMSPKASFEATAYVCLKIPNMMNACFCFCYGQKKND